MLVLIWRKNKVIENKNIHLFATKRKDIEKDRLRGQAGSACNEVASQQIQKVLHDPEDDETDGIELMLSPDEISNEELNENGLTSIDERELTSSDGKTGVRKYSTSTLNDETRMMILEKINSVFEDESLFCQENFSLQTLAKLCDTNQRYASQIINETMGMNFSSLLNEKRVNVACKRLMDTEKYGHLTIEAVISDLGFKSRSTFSKTFKRLTGLTPGEFQRLAKQGQ